MAKGLRIRRQNSRTVSPSAGAPRTGGSGLEGGKEQLTKESKGGDICGGGVIRQKKGLLSQIVLRVSWVGDTFPLQRMALSLFLLTELPSRSEAHSEATTPASTALPLHRHT